MLNTLEKHFILILKISLQVMLLLAWNLLVMELLVDGDNSLDQLILKKLRKKRQDQLELSLVQMELKTLFTEVIVSNLLQENPSISSGEMPLIVL